MFLHKSLLVGMISFLLVPGTAIATTKVDVQAATLEANIELLRHCYEAEHKVQAEVAECMSAKMKDLPNPEHFKVNMTGDIPGYLIFILYDQAGNTTKCQLYAGRTIELRQCMNYQANPLTINQELSILPPN